MKRTTLIAGILISAILQIHAQAPKYAFFEDFTQASCGPCADQNPGFLNNILQKNPSTVREVSYHTSWPGYDPMYNYNTSQNNSRTSYYSITSVPNMVMMGNEKKAQPGSFTQDDVDGVISETSPIKIRVTDEDNGTDHTVTVVVESWGTPPTGTSWKLRTAIIERNVNYTSAPGSNGEKYFPNVFRKMLPSTTGDAITFASMGGSVTFTYTYTEDAAWNMDEIGVVSFVQNETNKQVENCGASFDPDAYMSEPTILTHAGSSGVQSSFDVSASNNGMASQEFLFTLTSDAPSDWSSSFVVDGNTFTSSGSVIMDASESKTATIHVTPGSTAALGTYTLTVTNVDDPNDDPVSESVYIFYGLTDLIVNGVGGEGDQSGGTPEDWDGNFVSAINNTGCITSGVLNSSLLLRANTENSLAGIKYIYYNVGWSFPAFSDDDVAYLETFLNSGGNLFISGQDLGWDVWGPGAQGAHPSQSKQDFYNNYLNADYIDDGGTSNSQLTPVDADDVFGDLPNMTIVHHYGSFFYPDQISAINIGVPIFNYNSSSAKVGGVRADNGIYKVVYVAPGMEMFTPANAGYILSTTYNWFHGLTGIDEAANGVLGMNYPNPADQYTIVPVSGLKGKSTFMLFNSIGQLMMTQDLNGSESQLQINTSGLVSGVYHYQIASEGTHAAHTLQVIH